MTVDVILPQWQCHKKVKASKIKAITRDTVTQLHLEAGTIYVSYDYDVKHNPEPGGYYVVYEDGYTSFSPQEAFESGYTQL